MLDCFVLQLYCLCGGRVYEARRGGELLVPASDKMCWLGSRQPGVFHILQRAGSLFGLHVWQRDHINLIFKLQHAVPTTPCKLFLGGRGCEEHAPSGMHVGRMAGAAKEVSATTGNGRRRARPLGDPAAFVKGGGEATREGHN